MNNQNLSIEFFIRALNNKLPGIEAHKKMMPHISSIDQPNIYRGNFIESAVLTLLIDYNNTIQLCLIKRNPHLKVHPGQISFPGGKIEEGEPSYEYTALRETNEEIGIDINNVKILGRLSDVYIPVSNFVIHPVIGYYKGEPTFKLNKNEVEEIIIVPFDSFIIPDNISKKIIISNDKKIEVPCFKINDIIIWGATAMIISELIQIVVNHKMST